jgi:hypothetical protein
MIRRAFSFIVRRGFRLCLFALALAFGGMLANGVISEPVKGSGKSVTEDRPIKDVTEMVVSGNSKVELVRGNVPRLRVTADDNILPFLVTNSTNGKLTFQIKPGVSIQSVTPISYTVTLPHLEKLTVSGTGIVQAAELAGDALAVNLTGAGNATLKNIDCKSLTLTLSGAGNSKLTGSVEKAVVRLSGAGEIDALGLKATAVDTNISGAGTAKVWATDSLKVKVSGAGTVEYKGDPRIEQKISGAGSVKSLLK